MTDKEKVVRLKNTKNVDAWITQFVIELEEKRPELGKMLTKEGWETLPDASKNESLYTPEEKEAIQNNKEAHRKIVKAMGLDQKLINMVKTQTSEKAKQGCAFTAITSLRNELGDSANNELEDLEDKFDEISLSSSTADPLQMIKELEDIANDANVNHNGTITKGKVMRRALNLLPEDKYESIIDKYKGEGKYDSDELKDTKKRLKVKYNTKKKKWKKERKKKRKTKQKESDSDNTSSDSEKNERKEYIGQIMDVINYNMNNKREYCNLAQGNQQDLHIPMQQQRTNGTLRPGTFLGYNQTSTNEGFICRRCGRKGHMAKDCTFPPQVCGYCGGLGHGMSRCWEREENAANRPHGFISRRTLPCAKCGEIGHFIKDCPLINKAQAEQNQGVREHLGIVSLGGRFVDYVPPKENRKSKRETAKQRQTKDTSSQISLGASIWDESSISDSSETSNEEFCCLITLTNREIKTENWTQQREQWIQGYILF